MVERERDGERVCHLFTDLTCVGDCSNMNKLTDGCEINTQTDANNCGGCGMACSSNNVPTPSCGGGMCNGACSAGYANWYALVSELTCSNQCTDGEELWLAVTTPSGPTAATSTPTPTTTIAVFAGTRAPWVQPASLGYATLSQTVISRLVTSPVGPSQAALRLLNPEQHSMATTTSLEAVLPALELVSSKQSR